MNRRAQGVHYEKAAARHLEEKGYRILARNWRVRGGEIDLIAEKPPVLAFVEVKMRTSDSFGRPESAVTPRKQRRILLAARRYLAEYPVSGYDIRFDVITLSDANGSTLVHIENAFSSETTQIEEAFYPTFSRLKSPCSVISPDAPQLEKSNLRLDEYYLVYHHLGRGKRVCLFLHGFPTHGLLWRKVIPRMAESDYACVAPDQFGLGQSDGPREGNYSLLAQAEVLHRFIERLNLKNIVLVGHDTGGGVAQILACRYSDRIGALVLTNSVLLNQSPGIQIRLIQAAIRCGLGSLLIKPRLVKALAASRWGFPRGLCRPEALLDEMVNLYLEPLMRNPVRRDQFRRYLLALSASRTRFLAKELKSFTKPTLIAWASQDSILPPRLGRQLSQFFPHTDYISLAQGGHYHMEEEPEQFSRTLLDFLQRRKIHP